MNNEIIAYGKTVIHDEIKALESLIDAIGDDYVHCVKILQNLDCGNRLFVTGIGKSGYIAKKIASTFASIGIPCMYLHPCDTSHGELAILCEGDILIAISKSGETEDLKNILNYSSNKKINIIAITCNESSFLAKRANCCLIIPCEREACEINFLPTSSALAMLSLGDALALTLFDIRKPEPEKLHACHPSGSVGSMSLDRFQKHAL